MLGRCKASKNSSGLEADPTPFIGQLLPEAKEFISQLLPEAGPPPTPGGAEGRVQGYLAHKNPPSPRTLQQDSTLGPMVVLGGGTVSYERGAPVRLAARGGPVEDSVLAGSTVQSCVKRLSI